MDPTSVDLRRCLVPRAALEFVCACSPGHGLLAADWLEAGAEGSAVPPESGRLPPGFRAVVEKALRRSTPQSSVTLPFDPADYLRNPHNWRAPSDVPPGSAHARKVWQALCRIPVGETRSYGEIAREIGSAPRAVGQACRANPWPVFIPCHRVIPASGQGPGAYAGQMQGPLAAIKVWLLDHERSAGAADGTG